MAHIMLVSRTTEERAELARILIEDGHSVHQTDDGGSALELIRVLKPYVAVIDIDVANLDGITLLREIRRSSVTRGLPVVLTGSSERAAIRASALHLGVVDYLVRPFDAADVALRVKWSLKDQGSVPAVPWDLTNLNLRELLSDGPETAKTPERSTGISKAGFRKLADDAGYLPGARMKIMTPEKGGMVETGDGIVRAEVPPGSVRRAMSLGAARVNGNSEMLAESLRIKMGRRVADLTFIDQSGAPVSGPVLDRPIRISIKYDERDVAEAGLQGALAIEKYRAEDQEWEEMRATVDQKSRRMTTWEKDFNPNRAKLKGKLLVAHREDDEGESLNDAMEAIGFEILPESDGLVVARRVAVERPDVVLLDLAMPRLDGIQVLRQTKSESTTRATSVIVLAESEDRNLQSSLMTMGVRELILKPWHPGDIQRRVKRAYETSRAKQRQMKRAVDRVRARQSKIRDHARTVPMSRLREAEDGPKLCPTPDRQIPQRGLLGSVEARPPDSEDQRRRMRLPYRSTVARAPG